MMNKKFLKIISFSIIALLGLFESKGMSMTDSYNCADLKKACENANKILLCKDLFTAGKPYDHPDLFLFCERLDQNMRKDEKCNKIVEHARNTKIGFVWETKICK